MTKIFTMIMMTYMSIVSATLNQNYPFKWIHYTGNDEHYLVMKDNQTFYLSNTKDLDYYSEQGVRYAEQTGKSRLLLPTSTVKITSTLSGQVLLIDDTSYIDINATDAFYHETIRFYTEHSSYEWKTVDHENLLIEIKLKESYQLTLTGITEFETSINNVYAKDEILETLSAYSSRDGDISNKIILDSHPDFYKKLGNTNLTFSVTDSLGIKTTHTVKVFVLDKESPVISDKGTGYVGYSNPLTLNQIKSHLSVTDNLDQKITLEVLSDEYTRNSNKVGTYEIIFLATDLSGNETKYAKVINVFDDKKPVIEGPKIIKAYLNKPLTHKEVLDNYDIKDEIDTNDDLTIEWLDETYFNHKDKLGLHHLSFKVSDFTNNYAIFSLDVDVSETPNTLTEIGQLTKKEGESFSEIELIDIIGQKDYQIKEIVKNELSFDTKLTPGIYRFIFKIDDTEMTYQFLVRVEKTDSEEDKDKQEVNIKYIIAGSIIFMVGIAISVMIIIKKKNQNS